MNEALHITERIDQALNILQRIPGLQGYDQWNPVCETMRILAGIGQDVKRYEEDHKEPEITLESLKNEATEE